MRIAYNPLYKPDGKTKVGALTSAPINDIVFDLPGKSIWAKGLKFLGTDSLKIIIGSSSDTVAGTWTGQHSEIGRYEDGLTIIYIPKVAGASTTTLNINGLGAKTCYYSGNSKLTTHYPAGTPILFTYYNDGWRRADYDASTVNYRPIKINDTLLGNDNYILNFKSDSNISYVTTTTSNLTNLTIGINILNLKNNLGVSTTINSASTNDLLPTSKSVYDFVGTYLTSYMHWKGNTPSSGTTFTIPSTAAVGDTYRIAVAGTIPVANSATGTILVVEVGDIIICTDSNGPKYIVAQTNWTTLAGTSTLAWNSEVTLATIGGLEIKAKLPVNPNSLLQSISFKKADGTLVSYNGSTAVDLTGGINYAALAGKVVNNLVIKLNGGTTEGTNLFTYNGSAAKTVNITPASIGAATSGHTHTTTIAASTDTNQIALVYGGKYKLTAGGTTYVFTMPASDNTNTAHTTFTWTEGTTAGPTGTLSGNHTAVLFPAIPSASTSASGIVTTGALTFAGIKTFTSELRIGSAAAGPNFISFYGVNGDAPGSFNHTYIGERIWNSGTEASELLLIKSNDIGNGFSGTTGYSSGPDRIRHIAASHVFLTYGSALSGTFETVATSTVPITKFDISHNRITAYGPVWLLDTAPTLYFLEIGAGGTAYIRAYGTGASYNTDMVIHSSGSTIIGAGESALSIYDNNIDSIKGSENMAISADGYINFYTNCDTIGNRKHVYIDANGYVYGSYFNSNIGQENSMTVTSVYCSNDTWIRKKSLSQFAIDLFSNFGVTRETRYAWKSDNTKLGDYTGFVTNSQSYLEIRGFCPPEMYRTSHDRPAPFGLGFGNGSESGGIMPIGAGDKLQEIMFYGANSGPTIFTWKRQLWEGTNYQSTASNSYSETMMSLDSSNGNFYVKGTVGIGITSPSQKLHVSGGIMRITNNGKYVDIGALNSTWIHFQADQQYYFYNSANNTAFDTHVRPYSNNTKELGASSLEWATGYIRQIHTRHIDHSANYTGDSDLYIGYNGTASTRIYSTSSKPLAVFNGTIALNLSSNINTRPAIAFRDGGSLDTTVSYHSAGSEALSFITLSAATSFLFYNGTTYAANNDRWYSLINGVLIKNNCMAIGLGWANGVNPDYKLKVGGTIYSSSYIYGHLGDNKKTIKVDGDANTYYPVLIANPTTKYPMFVLSITRHYSETAPDTWYTATHKGGLTFSVAWNGSTYWDGNGSSSHWWVIRNYQVYSTLVANIDNYVGYLVVWLRGGGATYHLFSPAGVHLNVVIKYDSWTDGASRTAAPTTTASTINCYYPIGVDSATNSTYASYASNYVMTYHHLGNDVNYPLVWSNSQATSSRYSNLYTSYDALTFNTSARALNINSTTIYPLRLSSSSGECSIRYNCSGSLTHVFGCYTDRSFLWNSSIGQYVSFMNNGNVGIGVTPSYKLDVNGDIWARGAIRIGSSDQNNYLAFYGVYGDYPGGFDHSFIGERIYSSGTESSELLIAHGNDIGDGNGTYAAGSGCDRIRLFGGGIRFDIGNVGYSGWEGAANSASTTKMDIAQNRITTYGPVYMDNLFVINDSSNSAYDALAYFRNYSNNDWGLIIDKSQNCTYGLDIRTGGTYALRVGNGNTRLIGATIIGADATPSYTLDVRGHIRATENLIVSTNNTTGGGIIFADDGDIVDLNDAYCTMRFTSGIRITNANRGGGVVQELNVNGKLYNYGLYHYSYGSSDYFLTSDGGARYWPNLYDGRYLRYEGWWSDGSGQNVNDSLGMNFTYVSHGAPHHWGTTVTFEASRNSGYRLQLHGTGDNYLFFRNRSSDYGGWHSSGWKQILTNQDTYVASDGTNRGIINGTEVASARHLLINGVTWNSNWHWSGQSGLPTYLWGSNDGSNMYVWNPSNFRVDKARGLFYSGTGTDEITAHQTPDSYFGRSGWATYIIGNHGSGASYYHQIIAMPFWGMPQYQRMEGGTNTSWYTFAMMDYANAGNLYAAHFYENSDIRQKTDLSPLNISIKELSIIPLFNFSWKEDLSSRNTGTSAQAVQSILPNLVTESGDYLKLDYGVLGTIAGITACKELVNLKSEIEILKDRIELLEQQLKMYHGNSK